MAKGDGKRSTIVLDSALRQIEAVCQNRNRSRVWFAKNEMKVDYSIITRMFFYKKISKPYIKPILEWFQTVKDIDGNLFFPGIEQDDIFYRDTGPFETGTGKKYSLESPVSKWRRNMIAQGLSSDTPSECNITTADCRITDDVKTTETNEDP